MADAGLAFPITCLNCGGGIRLRQAVVRAGTESFGIVDCTECHREYSVLVHLRHTPKPEAERRQRYPRT